MIASLLLPLALQALPVDTVRLDLATAMDAARRSALPARIARSEEIEGDARVAEARSELLPHVGVAATHVVRSYSTSTFGLTIPTFPSVVDPFATEDARVYGTLTLWDLSAWKRYHAARLGADQASGARASGEEEAALGGAGAYLALLRARSLAQARRSEVELAEQLLTLTASQRNAGVATRLETLRAQTQLSAARMDEAVADGDAEAARLALLQYLDLPLDAAVVTGDSLAVDSMVFSSGIDEAAARRPEVAAAAAGAQAMRAETDAARFGLVPTLELSGDYGLSGRRLNGGADWTEDLALRLNWNLWDGGGRDARARERNEKTRQAELRLANLRTEATREARAARVLLLAAREETNRARERVAFSEEEARLAQEKFRAGSSGNLEVITAQQGVSAAHEAYVNSLYGYNLTRLKFLRAVHLL